MNFDAIRKNFPIFFNEKLSDQSTAETKDKPLVYFDNAASSHKPASVIDAVTNFYRSDYANVHRAFYPLAEQATAAYEQTRSLVTRFINAASPEEIVFTKGTTEGINFIASTWARTHLKHGDEILISQAEHHANLLPWQRVAAETGARLVFIPLNPKTFTLDYHSGLVTEKTRLVAVTHASNVLNTIWGTDNALLTQLINDAHQHGARVLIDAAQSIAHQKINIQTLGADFLVFSGHKMLAPTGVGILYIKKELHDAIEPYHVGGSMIHSASFESATWAHAPHKFEAGTPAIASILGLGAAISYFNEHVDFAQLEAHETNLCKKLFVGLQKIEGVFIAGTHTHFERHAHLISFSIEGIHPHDLASFLGERGFAVRAGHHCAQPLVGLLGVDALLRISFGMYNTADEVEAFITELNNAIAFFRKT